MNEKRAQSGVEDVTVTPAKCPVPLPRWGRWAAVGAFVFFLVKGLAWLAVPMLLAWWVS